jgi:TonB family protein
MIAVGCAAICAIAGGLWGLTRGDREAVGSAEPVFTVAADDPADQAAALAFQSQADEASGPRKTAEQPPREDRSGAEDERAIAAAAPAPTATGVIDANQLVLVKSVQPDYPRKAREDSIEGWVELDFTVAESGRVRELSVRAANPRGVFDQAAIGAVSQWRYKPALVDAKPVAQRARIRVRFALAH